MELNPDLNSSSILNSSSSSSNYSVTDRTLTSSSSLLNLFNAWRRETKTQLHPAVLGKVEEALSQSTDKSSQASIPPHRSSVKARRKKNFVAQRFKIVLQLDDEPQVEDLASSKDIIRFRAGYELFLAERAQTTHAQKLVEFPCIDLQLDFGAVYVLRSVQSMPVFTMLHAYPSSTLMPASLIPGGDGFAGIMTGVANHKAMILKIDDYFVIFLPLMSLCKFHLATLVFGTNQVKAKKYVPYFSRAAKMLVPYASILASPPPSISTPSSSNPSELAPTISSFSSPSQISPLGPLHSSLSSYFSLVSPSSSSTSSSST